MKIYFFVAEEWKMDGGVAFGVVPKTIWESQYPVIEDNIIPIVNRLMAVKTGNRLILVDTGFGNKRDEKYYRYKYITFRRDIRSGPADFGFAAEDVTDVIFTHLHDDHAGGAVEIVNGEFMPLFPNANHWVSKVQYDWAMNPNSREVASYFYDNIEVLENKRLLKFVEHEGELLPGIEILMFDGHTGGQMVPLVSTPEGVVAFMADFIPSKAHISIPYLASVDVQPLVSLKEKEEYLKRALIENHILAFQHDYYNIMCKVVDTPKGIRGGDTININVVKF